MVQRYNFEVLTNLGNMADPVLPMDATTKNYVDTTTTKAFIGTASPNTTNPMGSKVGDLYVQSDATPPTKILEIWYKTTNTTNPWIVVEDVNTTTLQALTDVNVIEGAAIDGRVLTWNNATSRWIAVAPTPPVTYSGNGIVGNSATLTADFTTHSAAGILSNIWTANLVDSAGVNRTITVTQLSINWTTTDLPVTSLVNALTSDAGWAATGWTATLVGPIGFRTGFVLTRGVGGIPATASSLGNLGASIGFPVQMFGPTAQTQSRFAVYATPTVNAVVTPTAITLGTNLSGAFNALTGNLTLTSTDTSTTAITSPDGSITVGGTAAAATVIVNQGQEVERIDREIQARVGLDIPRRISQAVPYIPTVAQLKTAQDQANSGYYVQVQTFDGGVSEILFNYPANTPSGQGNPALGSTENEAAIDAILAANGRIIGFSSNGYTYDWFLSQATVTEVSSTRALLLIGFFNGASATALFPFNTSSVGTPTSFVIDSIEAASAAFDPQLNTLYYGAVPKRFPFNAAVTQSIAEQFVAGTNVTLTRDGQSRVTINGTTNPVSWTGSNVSPNPTIADQVQLGIGLRGEAGVVSGQNIMLLNNTPFFAKYDQAYPCVSASTGAKFLGYLSRTPANEVATSLTLPLTANLGTVSVVVPNIPVGIPSGTSVVVFELNGRFNIIEAIITTIGNTSTLTGTLSTLLGSTIPAGNYDVLVETAIPADEAGVATLNGLSGQLNLTSIDNSVQIRTSGQNINLAAAPGGAGVATGYNIGAYVQSNITTYAGAVDMNVDTQVNEGTIQIGAGTGYSTNSNIIAPPGISGLPSTNGWTFNGTFVNNVVAEISAQKQVTRIGLSGNWVAPATANEILWDPLFLKFGADYNTSGAQFTGFESPTVAFQRLAPVNPSVKNFRYCLNTGITPTNTNGILTQVADDGTGNRIAVIGIPSVTGLVVGQQVTMPITIDSFNVNNNNYVASEWTISNINTVNNTFTISITGNPPVGNNVRLNTGNANYPAPTKIFIWTTGIPPTNTSFGTLGNTIGGYIEVAETPNTWFLDSITLNPQGFYTPVEGDGSYTFTKTFFAQNTNINAINVLSTDYRHFANSVDSWYSPSSLVNWDNRITVNFGSQGSAIPGNLWITWVNAWDTTPTIVGTQGTSSNGVILGTIYNYTYRGITRYRFIPNVYTPANDAFYSSNLIVNTVETVSGLLTARSS